MPEPSDEIEMFVAGLVMDPGSNAPIVLLKVEEGGMCLPIWIGLAEATAIASALKEVELVRPMTHDLLKNVIDELGARVRRVCIHGLQENTFLAEITLIDGEVEKVIDARPSDAIALAVRVNAPIFVAKEVLDKAKVLLVEEGLPDEGNDVDADQLVDMEEEKSLARDFTNISKDQWEEILASMDPDDFKYKM